MADGSLAVQTALFTALDAALSAAVHDHVPQDQAGQYVVIGEDAVTQRDSKTTNGSAIEATVDVYDSDARGLAGVKGIMATIYDTLNWQAATVSGFTAGIWRYQYSTAFVEPEGARGVMRFELWITEN